MVDIFKSGDDSDPNNYRPMSLLFFISYRIQNNNDKGMLSCGIFIDHKKAFDTVDHVIVLCKLNHYGIKGVILNWFSSYLKFDLK